MLKKEITYKDYNGTERTESFYFNLSQAELMEMEMSTSGGYSRNGSGNCSSSGCTIYY